MSVYAKTSGCNEENTTAAKENRETDRERERERGGGGFKAVGNVFSIKAAIIVTHKNIRITLPKSRNLKNVI